MHIPDGFLAVNTWAPAWALSIAGLAVCLKKTKQILKDKMVPLMGITAAFIFVIQLFDFPVVAGASGHLLGAGLAAVLLGPYAGVVVMASVLIVQCLLLQDGGLLALGANMLSMAVAGVLSGYGVYALARRFFSGNKGIVLGSAAAAWVSVVVISAVCAIELALSNVSPFEVAGLVLVGVHMIIGIAEAVVTLAIVSFLLKRRPDLIWNTRS